jgi:hypothetical protein
MTPDEVFDALTRQIMERHFQAAKIMKDSPQLRTVITHRAMAMLERAVAMIGADQWRSVDPYGIKETEFRGSKLTIVPGDDIYFHTRCTNLP